MASQPIDQGAILRSGALLIPNLADQIAQRDQLDLQRQQVGVQMMNAQRQIAEDAREQATARSYAADLTAIGQLPANQQPAAIIALMRKYPKQSEALKRSYDAQDDAVKQANFREAGEIYSLIQNGATDRAVAKLRARIDADRAAGVDTADDEAILAQLESGDPAQVQQATATIGWQLSTAAGPDKFASTFGAINPITGLERESEYIERTDGAEAADLYRQGKYDPIVTVPLPGGRTYVGPRSGLPGMAGSDSPTPQQVPSSASRAAPVSDAKSIARGLFDNIAITDHRRDPNSALGKANPRSWHNRSGAAIDAKPIPGMTFQQYVKRYRDAGYTILEARNEVGKGRSPHATGDHWHVVLGGGPTGSSPIRVTSLAQARSLPSGTEFIDPKGVRRRVP